MYIDAFLDIKTPGFPQFFDHNSMRKQDIDTGVAAFERADPYLPIPLTSWIGAQEGLENLV